MAVSFNIFLVVTILFSFAFGGDNLNCGNKTEVKQWELCCDDDVYRIQDPVRAWEPCNIEPKNANMTFADSVWLAYGCNIRKNLNSTELTLQSYISLLLRAQNSSQSFFWEALPFQSNISEKTVGEDDYEKIQTIKLYHREGVQAIEESCNFGGMNSTADNSGLMPMSPAFKTRFYSIQHAELCNNEMLPYSDYFAGNFNRDPNHANFYKCRKELNYTLGNATHSGIRGIIMSLCRLVDYKQLDLVAVHAQIKKQTIDLEDVVSKFFPAFWSKWGKDSVKNVMFENLKLEFKAQDLQNLESLMRDKVEKKFNQEFPEAKWGKRLIYKRELVEAILFLDIYDAYRKASMNTCRLDMDRKFNEEVL